MKKPNLFIVGAPKCGTTSLAYYLKQHPEIFFPERKEPHFFGTDLNAPYPYFIRDLKEYSNLFSDVKNEKIIGEASVWYIYLKRAAAEIKAFCPHAKIIIMLRNPVDMMYSLHSQRLYTGNEDIADFQAALEAEEDRKRGRYIPKGVNLVEGLFYRKVAMYTSQVKRYLDIFNHKNVHIIIFDDFEKNTSEAYRQTLHFLGVSENFYPDFTILNKNKSIRNLALRNFMKNPPMIVRKIKKALPRSLLSVIRHTIIKLNTSCQKRSPMPLLLRRRLQEEFIPEVEKLNELLNRDLTHWVREKYEDGIK